MEEKILTVEDMMSDTWRNKWAESIQMLREGGNDDAAERSEAQMSLMNFIRNLGGVREDINNYLLTPRFADTTEVVATRGLLCYAAPVEWMELAVEALNRDSVAGSLYVNEITEAYKAGIPVERVSEFLKKAASPFEMCHQVFHYKKELHDSVRKNNDNASYCTTVSNDGDVVQKIGNEIGKSILQEIRKVLPYSVAVQQTDKEELHDSVTGSDKEEPYDNVTGSDKEELRDSVTGSDKEEPYDNVTGSDKEELRDSVTGSEREKNKLFFDGAEIAEPGLLVMDLEKEQEKYNEKVSFFQMLLNRHMRKAFLKLDEKSQNAKIFEIMIAKKYSKGKILSIKRLLDGKMTNEFVFSLLEREMSEEELAELCDTLLEEINSNSSTDTARPSVNEGMDKRKESEEAEEETV